MDFLILNGEIIKKEEVNLTSLFWGEPLTISQKMWYGYGGIPLFTENLHLIHQQLTIFGATIPVVLKNKRELFRITKRMLNKNKFFRSGIINFQLYIYNSTVKFIVTCTSSPEFEFPVSKNGLLIRFSDFKKHTNNPFNRYNFSNQPIWRAEEAINEQKNIHNSVFLNENEKICEAISSNIFMIKNKSLITPSLKTGCYENILREHVLSISEQLNFKISESETMLQDDIFQMNEIFLASEERGIEWVLGIENKRFVRRHSIEIHQRINDFLKNKVI